MNKNVELVNDYIEYKLGQQPKSKRTIRLELIDFAVGRNYALYGLDSFEEVVYNSGLVRGVREAEECIENILEMLKEESIITFFAKNKKNTSDEMTSYSVTISETFNNAKTDNVLDYNTWMVMGTWTIKEAILLTLEKDPNSANISDYAYGSSILAKEYQRILDLVRRSIDAKEINYKWVGGGKKSADKKIITPKNYIQWAISKKIKLPKEMLDYEGESNLKDEVEALRKFTQVSNEYKNEMEDKLLEFEKQIKEKDNKIVELEKILEDSENIKKYSVRKGKERFELILEELIKIKESFNINSRVEAMDLFCKDTLHKFSLLRFGEPKNISKNLLKQYEASFEVYPDLKNKDPFKKI